MSQAEVEAERVARAVIRRLFQDNYAPRKPSESSNDKATNESEKASHGKEKN